MEGDNGSIVKNEGVENKMWLPSFTLLNKVMKACKMSYDFTIVTT